MKDPLPENVEKARIVFGPMASTRDDGRNGAFVFDNPLNSGKIFTVVSDGLGWEHVSVSLSPDNRCPTWEEMCWVKDQFWNRDETVIQFHPDEQNYVNNHPYVLHLWKPTGKEIELPPSILVGIKKKRNRH